MIAALKDHSSMVRTYVVVSLFEMYGLDVSTPDYRELIGLAAYENPDATHKLADRIKALLEGREIRGRDSMDGRIAG